MQIIQNDVSSCTENDFVNYKEHHSLLFLCLYKMAKSKEFLHKEVLEILRLRAKNKSVFQIAAALKGSKREIY